MSITHWDNSIDPVYPVDTIDDKVIVSPEGTVQLALSKYRRDESLSDDKFAEYICELLGMIMEKNKLIINQKDVRSTTSQRFRILTFEKAK